MKLDWNKLISSKRLVTNDPNRYRAIPIAWQPN